MSADLYGYHPESGILILTICSFNKTRGGEPEYDSSQSILAGLPEVVREKLLQTRRRIRRIIYKTGEIDWGGIPLSELAFNANLVEGADFGGKSLGSYSPALYRYQGRFFQTLGLDGIQKLFRSRHHVLFLSGLYGVVRPLESIQLYSCPLKAPIAQEWGKTDVLTSVLIAYAREHELMCVLDLTAVSAYRELIDWELFSQSTGARVLHAFDTMGMGDNALISFGQLMKAHLLCAPDRVLLAIKSDQPLGGVIFRSLAETPDGLPHELVELYGAEQEIALLQPFSIRHLAEVMEGGNPLLNNDESQSNDDWKFTVGHEFRKAVNQTSRIMQGRIMEAVLVICHAPLQEVGDTQKPLKGAREGQWRFRLGDSRLIYRPEETQRVVHLLAFGPRSSVYGD